MKNWIIGGLLTALGITAAGLVVGSQYEHEYGEREEHEYRGGRQDVAPVKNALYLEECGSCHMAYQPGLLPAESWRRLTDDLADHFGENAELDADITAKLREYLIANAADRVSTGRSPRIARSLGEKAPLRFTETEYFRRQHDEIPPQRVKNNPELGSFSRCEACHADAENGSYDEHQVSIPGWGRWED